MGIEKRKSRRSNNLLKENDYMKELNFNKVYCYKLDDNYKDSKMYFYIK